MADLEVGLQTGSGSVSTWNSGVGVGVLFEVTGQTLAFTDQHPNL